MAKREPKDTFAGSPEERAGKASTAILTAIEKAQAEFRNWQATCDTIDEIYSRGFLDGGAYEAANWNDTKLDLFWASFEVLKPAVYARPPIPAVKPIFSDAPKVKTIAAEVLERATASAFARTGINEVMCGIRDDVLFAGRGVPWVRYDTDDGQRVVVDHMDRADFLHEPARKWSEVGWVAARFWLTEDEVKARFPKLTTDDLDKFSYTQRRERNEREHAVTAKAGIWEVWHRADNKVYWVSEGVDVLLDERAPQLSLSGFFPCPRPAYGTLKRRSLIPVPDWERYAVHFRKISDMTGRIYLLLDQVRMMGLIGGGGDIADAIEDVMASNDDQIVVRVNNGGMASVADSVVWLPLAEVASAIQGLIAARGQLIEDFYQLSGISDIMRGATEANETLGAQQLKSQYGSVRVRDRIDELQRVAADSVKIAAEIISEHFTKDRILEMAQMEIPSKRDIEKRIAEIEEAAEAEMRALGDRAEEMAAQAQQSADPQQAQAMLQQAQQEIVAKYGPMLAEAEAQVPFEDVMKLLRDDKARAFAFDVESDSTILTDELQEKASRNEFLQTFTATSQGLMGMAAMGEAGAQLAGEMMRFVLAPYRAGRQLDTAIEAFIEAAPDMTQAAQGQTDDGGLAEAQGKLAEAEMVKAQAATAKVQADGVLRQAEMQRKLAEMQQKAEKDRLTLMADAEKLRQAAQDSEAKLAKTQAEIKNLNAQTAAILDKLGLDWARLDLDADKATADQVMRVTEQQRASQRDAVDDQFRERGESRADMAFDREPGE